MLGDTVYGLYIETVFASSSSERSNGRKLTKQLRGFIYFNFVKLEAKRQLGGGTKESCRGLGS